MQAAIRMAQEMAQLLGAGPLLLSHTIPRGFDQQPKELFRPPANSDWEVGKLGLGEKQIVYLCR